MSAVLENQIPEEQSLEAHVVQASRPPTRLRLYYRSKSACHTALFLIHRWVNAVHSGVWVGLLDNEQIKAALFRHYEDVEQYTTPAHNLHGFIPYEKEMIHEHFIGCRSAIVAAAGGGREMIALAKMGLEVEGFECGHKLVKACQELLTKAGVAARVLEAQPDRVPPGLRKYDCGVVGLGAYAHILGRANRVAFMKDLRVHLSAGAPVFVSTSRRPNGSRYYRLIFSIAKAIRLLRGSREAIEVGDDLLHCFSHYFIESELRAEFQEAGFEMIACLEKHEMYAIVRA